MDTIPSHGNSIVSKLNRFQPTGDTFKVRLKNILSDSIFFSLTLNVSQVGWDLLRLNAKRV